MRADPAVAVVALLVALAGCNQDPPVPEGIPVDDAGKVQPTLQGFVVDESIRPMAGAEVRFLGRDVNASTDGDGHYEIHEPTERAEAVLVSAFAAGYYPRTQQVQVSGNVPARLDFALQADPYTEAFFQVIEQAGDLGCRVTAQAAGQERTYSCDGVDPFDPIPRPPEAWQWEVYFARNLAGVVVQVHWNPEGPATEQLKVQLIGPRAGGQGGEVLQEATATNPIRLEVTSEQAEQFGDWTGLLVRIEAAGSPGAGPLPVSVSQRQLFDVLASVFYVDPPPAGYVVA